MNIAIDWDDEAQTIIRLTLTDDWRWEEFYEANTSILKLIRQSSRTIYILVDYTHANTVPMGGVITHTRNILSAYPENWALMIFVTQNLLVQRLMTIFQTTFRTGLGKKVRLASSFNDAYNTIAKHRQAAVSVPD